MASIQEHLDKIKNAIFGKDVRQSIHDGLNKINQETESTSKKQEKLERTFDDLIINAGNSNAEVAAARNGFETLGKRLDGVDSQLDTYAKKDYTYNKTVIDEKISQMQVNKGGLTDDQVKNIADISHIKKANLIVNKKDIGTNDYRVVNNISESIVTLNATPYLNANDKIIGIDNIINVLDNTQANIYISEWLRFPYSSIRGKRLGILLKSKTGLNMTLNASFHSSMSLSYQNVVVDEINTNVIKDNNNIVWFDFSNISECDEKFKTEYGHENYEANNGYVYINICIGRYNNKGKHLRTTNKADFFISLFHENTEESDDYVQAISLTDAIHGVNEHYKTFFTPEDFGAFGDGISDDTVALQSAIDFCIKNKVNLKSKGGLTYSITSSLSFTGINEEEDLGGTIYNVKAVHANFDFGGSTIKMKAINKNDTRKVKYKTNEYPCIIHYFNSQNDKMNANIENLIIDCNNLNIIGLYCEQARKTNFSKIEIRNIKTLGVYCGFTSGNNFEKMVLKASSDNASGICCGYNDKMQFAQDNHFTDIFMIDVKIPFDLVSSMNYFTRCHPFMRTLNYINESTMFKLRAYDFEGVYRGICTPILTDCYCDTFHRCFDVSDRPNHRIISKGLTFINNTSVMTNFFNSYGEKYLYLVYTGSQNEYCNNLKIINSYMSGFVKDSKNYTRISDSGDLKVDEDFSILNNFNRDLDMF